MPGINESVIKGKYKATEYTIFITIVEHKEDEIQWTCSMPNSTDSREPETLKEAMTRPNGYLWKMSSISEVHIFLLRKACIPKKRIVLKEKIINTIPAKWVFKIK